VILESKIEILLLWTERLDGTISLRAVDTSEAMALLHQRAVLEESEFSGRELCRSWIEPRETNHLYGHLDIVRAAT
jgi:hypothetical protein